MDYRHEAFYATSGIVIWSYAIHDTIIGWRKQISFLILAAVFHLYGASKIPIFRTGSF